MKKRSFRSILGEGKHIPIVGQKPHKKPVGIISGVKLTESIARQLPGYLDEAKPKNCTCPPDKMTVHLNSAPDGTLSVILGHEQDCPGVPQKQKPVLAAVPSVDEQIQAAAAETPEGETKEVLVVLEDRGGDHTANDSGRFA